MKKDGTRLKKKRQHNLMKDVCNKNLFQHNIFDMHIIFTRHLLI